MRLVNFVLFLVLLVGVPCLSMLLELTEYTSPLYFLPKRFWSAARTNICRHFVGHIRIPL